MAIANYTYTKSKILVKANDPAAAFASPAVLADIGNITGTKYQEYQESGANRIYYNQYKVGTSFFVSASVRY